MPGKYRIGLFVLAFFGTLIITAPASLLAPILHGLSSGRFELTNSHGTLWNGEATPLLHLNGGSSVPLKAMHWEIQLRPLLTGTIKVQLKWDKSSTSEPTELALHGKQLEITHLALPLPAQLISEASPFLQPAQFVGSLKIQSDKLILSNQHIEGQATIHWTNAGSALSTINPLGNYQINLANAAENITMALSTTSGVLLLAGQGNWSTAQGLHFQGKARAAEGQTEMLSELLHHLGPEESPGIHSISISSP